MANLKRHFIAGKMNKSVDERLVPNGEYIDALNVRLGSTEASEIGSVENSKGNTQITTLEYNGTALSNSAKCIGVLDDSANEKLYWLVHDPDFSATTPKKLDLIVSIDLKTDALVYHVISVRNGTTSDTTLNFNPTYLVTGIDLVEDQLFFTDDFNPPRVINVKRNYENPVANVDQFTAEELLVIKKPPVEAPTFTLNLTPGEEDYLEERFICFGYRYKYADNQYSATSQFSEPAFTPKPFDYTGRSNLNEGMVNAKNQAIITYNSGGPLVVGIDLLFKESGNSIIKVIQKLDKQEEGLADNTDYTFEFNSNKIFTVLPDSQLLRLFDNVPRFAQAQTIMGNRLVYGNYVDGYDLKDKNGSLTRLEYTAELSSNEISIDSLSTSLSDFTFTIDGSVPVTDSKLTIDFAGAELTAGSEISIEFSLTHHSFSNTASPTDVPTETSGTTPVAFTYVLPQTFTTVNDLATSTDFIEKIGTALNIKPVFDAVNPTSCSGTTFTDNYNCVITPVLDSSTTPTWTKFASGQSADGQPILIGSSVGSDNLELTMLAMRRVNNTTTPTLNAYEYFSMSLVSVNIATSPSSLSLHSNRNYEVGIIYMDEFNRSTTALVSEFNSVNIPCGNAHLQNKIKVTIPPQQLAPSFATRYKFCLKPDRDGYETIYSNLYFTNPDTSETYFLLEGENAQKVEEGARLIVKKDNNGFMSDCRFATVLEKKAFSQLPIIGSTAPAGTYMRILANNFSVDTSDNAVVVPGENVTQENNAGDFPIQVYYGLSGGNGAFATSPGLPPYGLTITTGTRIYPFIRVQRIGNPSGSVSSIDAFVTGPTDGFVSNDNYSDIIEWYESNNILAALNASIVNNGDVTIPSFSNIATVNSTANNYNLDSAGQATFVWYKDTSGGASNGEVRFVTKGVEANLGSGDVGQSIITVRWVIIRGDEVITFETEPSDALPDVWFEGSDSYAIDQATGFHSGNVQTQTGSLPAIVNTDFGNCYSYGNGVESYRIRDSIKGKAFSLGERAFSTSAEDYQEADRFAALTYSGVFNTETNVNNLNEFNLGLLNFKNLEEVFGPIQILSGRETDILTLQEDKISYVLAGKNLLSDAAAGSAITSVPEVLGTQIARVEEYGISQNPESFVQYGFNKFFTDSKRGALLQLRGSGQSEQLTVISELGMRSFFRNLFIGSGNTQKLGAFDPYMNEFVISSNTTLLPQEEEVFNCGVTRTITVQTDVSSPNTFAVDFGQNVGACTIDYNVTSLTAGDSVSIAESYTGSSTTATSTGAGTLPFNKNTTLPTNGNVTLTAIPAVPGGKAKATVEITVGCPSGDSLTIINVCITDPADEGKFIHNEYSWVSGTYTSPQHTKQITFRSLPIGSAGPFVIADYSQITSFQGGGVIPADGATVSVTSNAIPPSDDYKFPATGNRLMFLRSNTLFPNTVIGINSLLAAATDITPSPIVLPTVTGTFTMPSGSNNDYLYIIHDYFS
tara:strand:- start:1002 stop:5423 length:4422 start_codon:yes stop_codon:yes gene_type:complete